MDVVAQSCDGRSRQCVVWWFARVVINMQREIPEKYVSKDDMRDTRNSLRNEMELLRSDLARDHEENSSKLDKIDAAVTGLHARIDAWFAQRRQ